MAWELRCDYCQRMLGSWERYLEIHIEGKPKAHIDYGKLHTFHYDGFACEGCFRGAKQKLSAALKGGSDGEA